uniref:Protein kinase domain-containing protein n=1 Tax=Globodera pallida TaxID=36090 RepID=A0A183CGR9_GLOPA
MQILRLKHDNQNKINEYYVLPKPISGGATSRVFHASPLDAVDIDGKPIKQCVTIKSVMLDLLPPEVMNDIRKEQQFLEVFRKKTHNKHIIHLFDEFEDTTKNRLIFVMER